jgi:hypothetical protein
MSCADKYKIPAWMSEFNLGELVRLAGATIRAWYGRVSHPMCAGAFAGSTVKVFCPKSKGAKRKTNAFRRKAGNSLMKS